MPDCSEVSSIFSKSTPHLSFFTFGSLLNDGNTQYRFYKECNQEDFLCYCLKELSFWLAAQFC